MDLQGIMLSELSQTETEKIPHDFTYMQNLRNKTEQRKNRQLFLKRFSNTENKLVVARREVSHGGMGKRGEED